MLGHWLLCIPGRANGAYTTCDRMHGDRCKICSVKENGVAFFEKAIFYSHPAITAETFM